MAKVTELRESLSYDPPGIINLNAYKSIAPYLCKQSLLTVFKLSYLGGNQKPIKFVKKRQIWMSNDRYQDLVKKDIDDFDETLLKTLLTNPKICDLGAFAYYTTSEKLSKQSLLTAFKLSYKGEKQDPKEYVINNKIWIDGDRFQDLKRSRQIDDYNATLLKTLLENQDICDCDKLINANEEESGESIMLKCFQTLEYSEWKDENSLEFWIRQIVNIRNEYAHNQSEKMTEKKLNEKLKNLKFCLQELIEKMKSRYYYPDAHCKYKIDRLERIINEKKMIVPIWKDLTASVESRLMEKVFECISKDKEIEIRLPSLENEHINLDVPPSKVYLSIKGKGLNRRNITSTNVVKELRDPKNFPNRCMVLVGLPGVGKTTTLFRIKEEHKYATMKNINISPILTKIHQSEFEKIGDIEVLIYQALRDNEHKSLSELLHHKFGPATELVIPHSIQLQNILLKRPSILLLDAIDESSAVSDQLVRDIWQTKNNFPNLFTIFTTRGSTGYSNALRECAGDEYDSMCINVTGLDPSEFLGNSEKLIDVILEGRSIRGNRLGKRKVEALSSLEKIRQKFPPVGTNPLLLTIAVRLVLDPDTDSVENLQSTTQLIKGMMESLKRRLCDKINVDAHIVDEYLAYLGIESLSMLQRKEFMFNSASIEKLTDKIKSLNIPEACIENVLHSFLSKKGDKVFQHLHAVTQSFLAAKALFEKLMKLSFGDLNHEIDNQIKEIPNEHQQTVLIFLVGILHDHEKNDALDIIALDVCKYFDFPQYNYYDALKATHIHLFQESLAGGLGKPNRILEREILKKAPDSINVGEEALEAIKYIMDKDEKKFWPKEITITIQSQPDNILNLIPILELLNKRNSSLELEVDHSSENLLRNLPENLEKLTLRWTLEEADKIIEAFNTRLPSLDKLYMLTIYLNEGGSIPEKGLPKLCYGGDLLIVDYEVSFNDKEVAKAARIMGWACNQRDHLLNGLNLCNAPLSGSGCSKLLDELSSLGVKALWLKVYFAHLAEGEREDLQKKAEVSGIRLFVPPGRDFFVRAQTTPAALNDFKENPHFTMDIITYGWEMLEATDQGQNNAALIDRLVKDFTSSSSGSEIFERSSDSSTLNTNVKDDLKSSISEVLQAVMVADPPRFQSLFIRFTKVFSNKDLQSSNFAGCLGIYRDIMRSLSGHGTPDNTAVVYGIDIARVLTKILTDFVNDNAADKPVATREGKDASKDVSTVLSHLSSNESTTDSSVANADRRRWDIFRRLSTALSKFSNDTSSTERVSNAVAGGIDIVRGFKTIKTSLSGDNDNQDTNVAAAVAGGIDIVSGFKTVKTSLSEDIDEHDTNVDAAVAGGIDIVRGFKTVKTSLSGDIDDHDTNVAAADTSDLENMKARISKGGR